MEKQIQGRTSRFEITHTDPDTGIVTRKVVEFPGPEYDDVTSMLFTKQNDYSGKFVSDDTPLGEQGKGKIFHYRQGGRGSSYSNVIVKYQVADGAIRFIDFKDIQAGGYSISVRHDDDSDYLEVDLGHSKFAPTDGKEVARIRWVLYATQKFNNELMQELNAEDDEGVDEGLDDDDEPATDPKAEKPAVGPEKYRNQQLTRRPVLPQGQN